ncbi:7-deoxyloganetin glucosyltransferase [Camellia lanceoleosa]|uniref:7-deoxyloganetin glucosyltransferase n=1 Tax=Camellia lanceoleosa TaxID=1840588 RepID=A0ACC0FKL6_9ERIC|nr:7-deoxyloganetin glucosyltransferase [Camellia lanceoleosa]
MCAMAVSDNKPHAVCIPFPAQSHIKGILKLAKLLHHKGFYITFVNTKFNQKRLIKAGGHDSLYGLPNFQFKTIPDGLPPSNPDATQDGPFLCGSVRKNFLTPFCNLLANLNDSSISNNPLVTCIVSDGLWPFTITVAQELGIPVAEVGMEIENNVKRDEVEKLVRELIEGEKGKKMKNKAMEWKKLVEKATSPGGSSSLNLDKLVNVLLSRN